MDVYRGSSPGASATRLYKAARRKAFRERWRQIVPALGLGFALLLCIPLVDGLAQVVAAAAAGFLAAAVVFVWLVGDVRALPYLWGATGEQQTAELLAELDPSVWRIDHDVPAGRGNWDHIVSGPAGVFLIDSKNFGRRAVVANDTLYAGRLAHPGAAFRASAAELSRTLAVNGRRTWVQPVVVIWGDFAQRRIDAFGVFYLAAGELLPWLGSQTAA